MFLLLCTSGFLGLAGVRTRPRRHSPVPGQPQTTSTMEGKGQAELPSRHMPTEGMAVFPHLKAMPGP